MTYSELLQLDQQLRAIPQRPPSRKSSKVHQSGLKANPSPTMDTTTPCDRDTTLPSDPHTNRSNSNPAKMLSNQSATRGDYQTTTTRAVVRRIRQAVHRIGKEAATYRFTREEKDGLAEVIYQQSKVGIRACENEIVRIGLNWLLEDHAARSQKSLLSLALKALRA